MVIILDDDKVEIKSGWRPASLAYFVKAAKAFRENFRHPVFVVTSDAMAWCKHNFRELDDFVFSELSTARDDMALLRVCNHTVMSVGTYSWWAAWLTGGTAVYYKDHVVPGSNAAAKFRHEDYFLPLWIPMSIT